MKVANRNLAELTPYAGNAKKHDSTQIANVAESIRQFGFVQPIVIDQNGVIVIGHCRALAAEKLGMKEVPCVCVDDLTPEQVNALRIVDNKSNESPWDFDILPDELADIDLSDFDFSFIADEKKENPYTNKIKIPQYEVQGEQPSLDELYDTDKTDDLIAEIQISGVSEAEKQFLIEAAKRHTVFNYKMIAEYYAQASYEMQQLMERSALVIIDYEDAIANGYMKLSKAIERMRANA